MPCFLAASRLWDVLFEFPGAILAPEKVAGAYDPNLVYQFYMHRDHWWALSHFSAISTPFLLSALRLIVTRRMRIICIK
jgi:hypothetical protein